MIKVYNKIYKRFDWVIRLFLIWYKIIVLVIIPKYYKVMRSRVEIEKLFYRNIKEGNYLIKLVKLYFINWIKELINIYNLNLLIKFNKNNIEGNVEKKTYVEVNNKDSWKYYLLLNREIINFDGLSYRIPWTKIKKIDLIWNEEKAARNNKTVRLSEQGFNGNWEIKKEVRKKLLKENDYVFKYGDISSNHIIEEDKAIFEDDLINVKIADYVLNNKGEYIVSEYILIRFEWLSALIFETVKNEKVYINEASIIYKFNNKQDYERCYKKG